ncbi:hypothetical protein AAGW05_13130 [Arthrobacter sp. LAPM80]|uniref:hypothetical protein n=1 Tax=Arthrobacter sp. LAPM80 TaxID=3141788 RepID=UPI00398AA3C1
MDETRAKADLQRYLQAGRDAVIWKLQGLGEHDARRPAAGRPGTGRMVAGG